MKSITLKDIFLTEDFGLEEDKFQDAVKQYPDLKFEIDIAKNEDIKPKYLPWLIKQYKLGYDNFTLIPVIKEFDKLVSKNLIKGKESDINQYKYYRELRALVNKTPKEPSATELKKLAKSQIKKIYEDEQYLIIQPLSTEASVYYGKGTKWCISATESDNYFEQYTNDGQEFLFIIDKLAQKSDLDYKTAIAYTPGHLEKMSVFNAEDENFTPDYLQKIFPQNILDVLSQHFGENIFEIGKLKVGKWYRSPRQFIFVFPTEKIANSIWTGGTSGKHTAVERTNYWSEKYNFSINYLDLSQPFKILNVGSKDGNFQYYEIKTSYEKTGWIKVDPNSVDIREIKEHNLDENILLKNYIATLIQEMNVLDKMGKKKVSKSIRRDFIGGGVYTEFPSDREAKVVKKVSKNLHRIPYSHNPPTGPIGSEPIKRKKKK